MTHTTKHTQGPWGVDATGQVCKRATNGSWDLIAYLDESPYYHNKFANAHLIAAAPAMYEALQWARQYLRMPNFHPDNSYNSEQWAEDYNKLTDALAQAEGRG